MELCLFKYIYIGYTFPRLALKSHLVHFVSRPKGTSLGVHGNEIMNYSDISYIPVIDRWGLTFDCNTWEYWLSRYFLEIYIKFSRLNDLTATAEVRGNTSPATFAVSQTSMTILVHITLMSGCDTTKWWLAVSSLK